MTRRPWQRKAAIDGDVAGAVVAAVVVAAVPVAAAAVEMVGERWSVAAKSWRRCLDPAAAEGQSGPRSPRLAGSGFLQGQKCPLRPHRSPTRLPKSVVGLLRGVARLRSSPGSPAR